MQHQINFQTHEHENNSCSEQHLYEHKVHFSKKCQNVFDLLMQGCVLTNQDAMDRGIHSISRRACDLIEQNIELTRDFITGTRLRKYYMTGEQIKQNKNFISK